MKKLFNELGVVQLIPILAVLAVVGIASFLFVTSFAPLKGLLGQINPKPVSEAQTINGVTFSMNPPTVATQLGQTFSLNLDVNTNATTLDAAELHISFDPTKLQVQSITNGTFMKDVLTAGTFDNNAGTAAITLGSGTTTATGTGTMAVVTFKVIANGSSQVLYASSTKAATNGLLSLQSSSGATVSTAVATASPIATPAPSIAPTPIPATPSPTPTPIAKVVTLSVSPSVLTTTVGQSFTTMFNTNTSSDAIIGAELHISFDPTKLQAQSITPGTIMKDILTAGTFDNNAGTAAITLGSGTTPFSGTGTLATMNFKAMAAGSSAIGYASSTLITSLNFPTQNGLSASTGANITVNPAPTPTPTPTPTLAPTPAPTPFALPAAPIINTSSVCAPASGYIGSGILVSWVNPVGGNPVSYVDISSDSSFSTYFNKQVTGSSTTAPVGFVDSNGFSLTLLANTNYFVRLYNNDPANGHSPSTSFSLPVCPTSTPAPTPSPKPTPSPVVTPTPNPTLVGGVAGQVLITKHKTTSPLASIQVCIVDSANNCITVGGNATIIYTDSQGQYSFSNLPVGAYKFKYIKNKPNFQFQSVTVKAGQTITAPIVQF